MKPNLDRKSNLRRFMPLFALVAVLALSFGLVFARENLMVRQTHNLEQQNSLGPRVLVMPVAQASNKATLDLPGSIHGYIETPVYAKVAGYLKTIRVDKGDRVHKGDVLAVIESPETDSQVANTLANYKLQLVTDERDQYLLENGVIAQQEEDNQHAMMLQSWASYQQARAYQRYEVVRAEFDGIITARYVDPGALIPQVTSPSTANPIVAMATLSPLRVYANAPQSVSPFVHDGDAAAVTVTEFPGRKFNGTVTRHPDALDQTTRTMLVEVDLPNRDQALLPGMYAEVQLNTGASADALLVPDDALIFRDDKIFVPTVRSGHLHLAAVTLGRDNGYRVEATGDIHLGDLIAMNVGESAHDCEAVQPIQMAGK